MLAERLQHTLERGKHITELVLWSIICQICNCGAGSRQRIVTTVHRIAHSVWRALLPNPHPIPADPVHLRHARAEVLHKTPISPAWFLHPSPTGANPYLGASPGSHQAQPHACWHQHTQSFHHAILGAAQGLWRGWPPAAAARCLLLSCPTQQPWGLGYRTVSNFVLVPRHHGRGT